MSTAKADLGADALHAAMLEMGRAARAAADQLGRSSGEQRAAALTRAAAEIRAARAAILSANEQDMAAGRERGLSAAMLDRLALSDERVEAMAAGIDAIVALPDPIRSSSI